jgi:hypothetical protein
MGNIKQYGAKIKQDSATQSKHADRPVQILGAQAARCPGWPAWRAQLDHRTPGDALQRAAARRQPSPVTSIFPPISPPRIPAGTRH